MPIYKINTGFTICNVSFYVQLWKRKMMKGIFITWQSMYSSRLVVKIIWYVLKWPMVDIYEVHESQQLIHEDKLLYLSVIIVNLKDSVFMEHCKVGVVRATTSLTPFVHQYNTRVYFCYWLIFILKEKVRACVWQLWLSVSFKGGFEYICISKIIKIWWSIYKFISNFF